MEEKKELTFEEKVAKELTDMSIKLTEKDQIIQWFLDLISVCKVIVFWKQWEETMNWMVALLERLYPIEEKMKEKRK